MSKGDIINSISKLEAECFGGSSENKKETTGLTFRLFDTSNIKNAYMLVYERKLKTPLKKVLQPSEVERFVSTSQKALECDNTALARVGQVYLDSKKNEYLSFTNFHDVKPRLPPGLYQEVWDDNITFLFERQIYSSEFFQFAQDIFTESYSLLPALPKPTSEEIAASMTRIASKIIYDLLAHAYYNGSIKTITEQLINLFKQSKVAAEEFLAFVLHSDFKETYHILTKCPDKDPRISISRLLAESLIVVLEAEGETALSYEVEVQEHRHMFKYKSKVGQALHLLLGNIDNDLAQNWLRFEQYFSILYSVVKRGGEPVAAYLNGRRAIAHLIDFYLGTGSPLYERGEKRPTMGNKFKNPKFQPLVSLISILALHSNLAFLQPHHAKIQETWGLPKALHELAEEEKKCLQCKEFLNKTITEGYGTTEFANLLAVLCYESKEFSKELSKTLLKAINEDTSINMVSYFTMLKGVLTIEDSLQEKRLEWLLGIAVPSKVFTQLTVTSSPHEQLKYGLYLADSVRDTITEYISPLNYKSRYESLLSLLWKHRKAFEIHPVKCLLDLMTKSPKIFQYVTSLPPPTYQYAKYPDWIRPVVVAYPTSTRTFMGFTFLSTTEKNLLAYKETINLLLEYEALWVESVAKQAKYTDREEVLLAFPQPYLIGKSVGENIKISESKDEVELVLSEVITEVYESFPTGKENLGVPPMYFENQKEEMTKLYQEKMGREEKNEEVKKVECQVKPWKIESAILKLEVRNNGDKCVKVKVDFVGKPAEGAAKADLNFQMPNSTISTILEGQKRAILHLATKKALGAPWGDFTISWKTVPKEIKKEENSLHCDDLEGYHYYMSDDDDDVYGKEYAPGAPADGTVCGNCRYVNNRKAEKCSRCGEMLDDDFYYI